GPDAASASGSEKERMSHLQSTIDEARRSYNAGDFSRYMTAKPIDKAECYVKETVVSSPLFDNSGITRVLYRLS
ncbi:hypothetical protein AVEN_244170-1, partial [Araneus ventricosus]